MNYRLFLFLFSPAPQPIYSHELKMNQLPLVSSTPTASQGNPGNKHKHWHNKNV